MSPLIAVVTGTNSGIGYETAKALLRSDKSYRVYCGARTEDKAMDTVKLLSEGARNEAVPLAVDISSEDSVQAAFQFISSRETQVDVLINNAGTNRDAGRDISTNPRIPFQEMFNTNVIGSHCLTFALAPLLVKSPNPRVIFVSSTTGSIAKTFLSYEEFGLNFNFEPGWPKKWTDDPVGYKASKTALNMIMRNWSRWLESDNGKVWAVCPGYCATHLINTSPEHMAERGGKPPAEAAAFIVGVVEGKRDADSGKFINEEGDVPY